MICFLMTGEGLGMVECFLTDVAGVVGMIGPVILISCNRQTDKGLSSQYI